MSNVDTSKISVPNWAPTVGLTVFLALLSYVAISASSRQEVENLKKDVDQLKPLTTTVAVLNSELSHVKKGVEEVRASQLTMQTDINEIKRLLSQKR